MENTETEDIDVLEPDVIPVRVNGSPPLDFIIPEHSTRNIFSERHLLAPKHTCGICTYVLTCLASRLFQSRKL